MLDKDMIDEIRDCYYSRCDKHYSDIRYAYEEELIDSGRYSRSIVSEVDDGWDQFQLTYFCDEMGIDETWDTIRIYEIVTKSIKTGDG